MNQFNKTKKRHRRLQVIRKRLLFSRMKYIMNFLSVKYPGTCILLSIWWIVSILEKQILSLGVFPFFTKQLCISVLCWETLTDLQIIRPQNISKLCSFFHPTSGSSLPSVWMFWPLVSESFSQLIFGIPCKIDLPFSWRWVELADVQAAYNYQLRYYFHYWSWLMEETFYNCASLLDSCML